MPVYPGEAEPDGARIVGRVQGGQSSRRSGVRQDGGRAEADVRILTTRLQQAGLCKAFPLSDRGSKGTHPRTRSLGIMERFPNPGNNHETSILQLS